MNHIAGMKQSILRGAWCGCSAWLVYGSVGLALSLATQLHFHSDLEIMSWQWPLIAILLAVPAAAGLLLGIGSGIILAWSGRSRARDIHQIAALLTIVLAFAAALASGGPLHLAEYLSLTEAVVLGTLFSLAIYSDRWRQPALLLSSSWIVSLVLLGPACMMLDAPGTGFSSVMKKLFVLCVCLLLAVAWTRVRNRLTFTLRTQPAVAGAIIGVAVLAIAIGNSNRTSHYGAAMAAQMPGKPNILLITMDTVRADHVSVYGYNRDTTPHLQDFSKGATVYSRAIASSDFTLPTHASIFTGMYPGWHGATYFRALRADVPTLAEVLRSHGYDTAESVANAGQLAPWTGMARGFTTVEVTVPVDLVQDSHRFYPQNGARRLLDTFTNIHSFSRTLRTASDISLRGKTLLASAKASGRPFFLFLNYMDAHFPYVPESPFENRFPGSSTHLRPSDPIWTQANSGARPLQMWERLHLVSQYDGGIAAEDSAIGDLLEELRRLGLYDNTLVIVTGDHGEALGERGLVGHSFGTLYQNAVSVPLLIKYPNRNEGRQSDRLVSQVDLMPTILDILGIAPPAALQGHSLLDAASADSEPVFAEARPGAAQLAFKNPKVRGVRRAIFSGSMKLIAWTDGPTELYDLSSDPNEEHDLYRSDDVRAIDLSNRLASWTAGIPRESPRTEKIDKTNLERLKSLGYAQ